MNHWHMLFAKHKATNIKILAVSSSVSVAHTRCESCSTCEAKKRIKIPSCFSCLVIEFTHIGQVTEFEYLFSFNFKSSDVDNLSKFHKLSCSFARISSHVIASFHPTRMQVRNPTRSPDHILFSSKIGNVTSRWIVSVVY